MQSGTPERHLEPPVPAVRLSLRAEVRYQTSFSPHVTPRGLTIIETVDSDLYGVDVDLEPSELAWALMLWFELANDLHPRPGRMWRA